MAQELANRLDGCGFEIAIERVPLPENEEQAVVGRTEVIAAETGEIRGVRILIADGVAPECLVHEILHVQFLFDGLDTTRYVGLSGAAGGDDTEQVYDLGIHLDHIDVYRHMVQMGLDTSTEQSYVTGLLSTLGRHPQGLRRLVRPNGVASGSILLPRAHGPRDCAIR